VPEHAVQHHEGERGQELADRRFEHAAEEEFFAQARRNGDDQYRVPARLDSFDRLRGESPQPGESRGDLHHQRAQYRCERTDQRTQSDAPPGMRGIKDRIEALMAQPEQ
jgi:hypothetical protein